MVTANTNIRSGRRWWQRSVTASEEVEGRFCGGWQGRSGGPFLRRPAGKKWRVVSAVDGREEVEGRFCGGRQGRSGGPFLRRTAGKKWRAVSAAACRVEVEGRFCVAGRFTSHEVGPLPVVPCWTCGQCPNMAKNNISHVGQVWILGGRISDHHETT